MYKAILVTENGWHLGPQAHVVAKKKRNSKEAKALRHFKLQHGKSREGPWNSKVMDQVQLLTAKITQENPMFRSVIQTSVRRSSRRGFQSNATGKGNHKCGSLKDSQPTLRNAFHRDTKGFHHVYFSVWCPTLKKKMERKFVCDDRGMYSWGLEPDTRPYRQLAYL